jgi:hypothetical protein
VELNDLKLSQPLGGHLVADLSIGGPLTLTAINVRNVAAGSTSAFPAVRIGADAAAANSTSATFVDCSFEAHSGNTFGWPEFPLGATAMTVINAEVHLAQTNLRGSFQSMSMGTILKLGAGLYLADARAVIYGGSKIQSVSLDSCLTGGCFIDGGIEAHSGSSLSYASDAQITGGTILSTGFQAPDIQSYPGSSVTALQRRLPTLVLNPSTGSPGTPLVVQAKGEPGALLVRGLALSTGPGIPFSSSLAKIALNPNSLFLLPAVTLPASGELLQPSQLPASPAAIGLTIFEQLLQVSLAGAVDLSPAAAVSVIP